MILFWNLFIKGKLSQRSNQRHFHGIGVWNRLLPGAVLGWPCLDRVVVFYPVWTSKAKNLCIACLSLLFTHCITSPHIIFLDIKALLLKTIYPPQLMWTEGHSHNVPPEQPPPSSYPHRDSMYTHPAPELKSSWRTYKLPPELLSTHTQSNMMEDWTKLIEEWIIYWSFLCFFH